MITGNWFHKSVLNSVFRCETWDVLRHYKTRNHLLQIFVVVEMQSLSWQSFPSSQQQCWNTAPKGHGSQRTKYALRKEQHKAEIFMGPEICLYFSYKSASDVTDVFKAVFPDISLAQSVKCAEKLLSSDQLWNCTILIKNSHGRIERRVASRYLTSAFHGTLMQKL